MNANFAILTKQNENVCFDRFSDSNGLIRIEFAPNSSEWNEADDAISPDSSAFSGFATAEESKIFEFERPLMVAMFRVHMDAMPIRRRLRSQQLLKFLRKSPGWKKFFRTTIRRAS